MDCLERSTLVDCPSPCRPSVSAAAAQCKTHSFYGHKESSFRAAAGVGMCSGRNSTSREASGRNRVSTTVALPHSWSGAATGGGTGAGPARDRTFQGFRQVFKSRFCARSHSALQGDFATREGDVTETWRQSTAMGVRRQAGGRCGRLAPKNGATRASCKAVPKARAGYLESQRQVPRPP